MGGVPNGTATAQMDRQVSVRFDRRSRPLSAVFRGNRASGFLAWIAAGLETVKGPIA